MCISYCLSQVITFLVFLMILPAVPRYPPIASLYLSDLLPTKKTEYLAYAFVPENFCRSTLNSCFLLDVRRCNTSFPKKIKYFSGQT